MSLREIKLWCTILLGNLKKNSIGPESSDTCKEFLLQIDGEVKEKIRLIEKFQKSDSLNFTSATETVNRLINNEDKRNIFRPHLDTPIFPNSISPVLLLHSISPLAKIYSHVL